MSHLMDEIASQPEIWSTAINLAAASSTAEALPAAGARVAVIGCGSSLNVARCYARLREAAGHGETDAYPASELTQTRRYDHMVLISRTGTTSEVLAALQEIPPGVRTTSLTADSSAPLANETSGVVLLDFADERSVVSSRFITATIALLRAFLGEDLSGLPHEAERALASPLPPELAERKEFTFLGRGWAAPVADEAALKLREASRTWAESYPAMEYRHGPVAVTGPGSVVWFLGSAPDGIAAEAVRAGGFAWTGSAEPLAELVRAQRLAVELATARGLDPDRPRHLTRSVILAPR